MIYEFTRATIKHNFPRAVLMTWWERYFIKAIAPRLDTETQAMDTHKKRTKCCPLTSGSFVGGIADDRDKRGHKKCVERTGYEDGTTHISTARLIFFWSYQIKIWGWFWGLHSRSLEAKLLRLHYSRWKA